MTPERWRQITEIFHGAIAIRDAPAREAYLHDACSDDPLLRQEIDSLLAAHVDGTSSIDAPLPQAVSLTNRLAPGTMLGPYRVEELIGAGGMGEVYRAHDSRLGRTVALKTLPIHLRASPQLLARFEREARAVAALNHPYICTLHDVGRDRGIDFLVMELVEGETLSSRLRRGRLPVDESVRIAREVAEALAAAHARGIIHRDIKPSNVILTSGGHAKVVDFGLARSSALFQGDDPAKDESTQTDVIVGTPRYMSPEQALGQPLDPRTDIFSLGAVLFECLTGELPFEGKTKGEYRQNLLTGHVKSIAALRSDVPDTLRAVLTRCLERNSARRLDSAAWLATELDQIDIGNLGHPRWHRLARWAALAAFVVILVALIVISYPLRPPVASTEDAQLRRFTTSAGEEFDSHLSPDQKWMSFIAVDRGERHLYVQQIDSGEARAVTLPVGIIQSHVWSPDQAAYACLVLQDPGWALQIVPALFGSDLPIRTVPMPQISRTAKLLRWIDQVIYLQVEESGRSPSLQRLNPNSKRLERLEGPWKDMNVRGFDVRPDGRQVVWSAAAGSTRDDLWLADLSGGTPTRLTGDEDDSRKRFPLWNGLGTKVIYQSNRGLQVDLWELDLKSRKSVRRTSDPGIERPESTSTNGSLSYQLTSQRTALWMWMAREGKGSQVSDEGLSDFAPSASQNPVEVVFQRSQPSPVEGFLQMDSDIFLADGVDPSHALVRPRKVGAGLAPQLSPDGKRLAFLQRTGDGSSLGQLSLRELQTGGLQIISRSVVLPSVTNFPVDWTEQNLVWVSSDDLYFVARTNRPEASMLAHFRIGRGTPSDLTATASTGRLADLYASADGKTIAYLTRDGGTEMAPADYQLHTLDLPTGTHHVVRDLGSHYIIRLRGWLKDDAGLVLVRSTIFNSDDRTWTYEVLFVSRDGAISRAGAIDHVAAVSRFVARHSDLYFTRALNGIENLSAYSLATHRVRQVSENSQRGVTFGGVTPFGDDHVIGIRQEQTRDIHLLDTRPRGGRGGG